MFETNASISTMLISNLASFPAPSGFDRYAWTRASRFRALYIPTAIDCPRMSLASAEEAGESYRLRISLVNWFELDRPNQAACMVLNNSPFAPCSRSLIILPWNRFCQYLMLSENRDSPPTSVTAVWFPFEESAQPTPPAAPAT